MIVATKEICSCCYQSFLTFDGPGMCVPCDPTISKEKMEPFAIRTENPRWSPAFSTEAYNKR